MSHNRAAAWSLLAEFTPSQPLRRHALSVEATMRALARSRGVSNPAELETWAWWGSSTTSTTSGFPPSRTTSGAGWRSCGTAAGPSR